MRLIVIDGQGGGVGRALVSMLKSIMPEQAILAIGTNVQATASMLKAGADAGATGDNAILYQCQRADIIMGVIGLLHANAMHGEISPQISSAVSESEATKILIPLERCGLLVAGVEKLPLDGLIRQAVQMAQTLILQTSEGKSHE